MTVEKPLEVHSEDVDADFTTHHVEGYARAAIEQGLRGYFKCPLISQIEGNLWTGGCRAVSLDSQFKYVISLYPSTYERYILPAGCQRVEVEMYDSDEMPDIDLLDMLAQMAAEMACIGPTLIHCQAGLNRSGLLGALTLMAMDPTRSAHEAIALLREKRSDMVLCNKTFEDWLLSLDAE